MKTVEERNLNFRNLLLLRFSKLYYERCKNERNRISSILNDITAAWITGKLPLRKIN